MKKIWGIAAVVGMLVAGSARAERDNPHAAERPEGAMVACAGCVEVPMEELSRGRVIAKGYKESGVLPKDMQQLKGPEIDRLLRGKSWTSAVLSGTWKKEYHRMMAFDKDGRGRWLNFNGGRSGYSTQCKFEVDSDMLCLSCQGEAADCSMIYRQKDMVLGIDHEQGRVEIIEWIMDSRWENDRFLVVQ